MRTFEERKKEIFDRGSRQLKQQQMCRRRLITCAFALCACALFVVSACTIFDDGIPSRQKHPDSIANADDTTASESSANDTSISETSPSAEPGLTTITVRDIDADSDAKRNVLLAAEDSSYLLDWVFVIPKKQTIDWNFPNAPSHSDQAVFEEPPTDDSFENFTPSFARKYVINFTDQYGSPCVFTLYGNILTNCATREDRTLDKYEYTKTRELLGLTDE